MDNIREVTERHMVEHVTPELSKSDRRRCIRAQRDYKPLSCLGVSILVGKSWRNTGKNTKPITKKEVISEHQHETAHQYSSLG